MSDLILTPENEVVQGSFKLLEKNEETPRCQGNACDCVEWRIDTSKKVTIYNGCDKTVVVKVRYASVFGQCSASRTVRVFPYETFDFQMPTQYLGVCLPVDANKA